MTIPQHLKKKFENHERLVKLYQSIKNRRRRFIRGKQAIALQLELREKVRKLKVAHAERNADKEPESQV